MKRDLRCIPKVGERLGDKFAATDTARRARSDITYLEEETIFVCACVFWGQMIYI